jgi:hypothetical protein
MDITRRNTRRFVMYFFWLYPYEKYGIDKHFQYHLINYNGQTAYAALTLNGIENAYQCRIFHMDITRRNTRRFVM